MATLAKFIAQDWVVFIVGQQNVQKGLLASFLEREFDLYCQVADNCADLPPDTLIDNRFLLLIRDCTGDTKDDIIKYLDIFNDRLLYEKKIYLSLINCSQNLEIESTLLERGVRGVLNNNVTPAVLIRFIRAVVAGELWFPRHLVSRCILESRGHFIAENNEPEVPLTSSLSVALSDREKEVLIEIGSGSTNEQIADHLCISRHTVKSHVYRIFKKINVPNRLQAALWASKYLA